jgi:hypothetical protein
MLAMVLNWLSGGVLTSVLGHLEKRAALQNDRERMQTEITIEQVKSELATRLEQAQIIKAELGHPIAWFPRFMAAMVAVLYFTAHITDAIWNLDGTVAPLPTNEAALLGLIFSGMFLESTFRKR